MKRSWLLRLGLYSGPIESDATLSFFVYFATRAPKQLTALIDAICCDGEAVSIGVTLAGKGVGLGHISRTIPIATSRAPESCSPSMC